MSRGRGGYRYRPPSRTVRLLRENVRKVLDLYEPVLMEGRDEDGEKALVCIGCGGRLLSCSPPFVAHAADCSEVERYMELDALLTPIPARKAKR
jgi:hypothetical protein